MNETGELVLFEKLQRHYEGTKVLFPTELGKRLFQGIDANSPTYDKQTKQKTPSLNFYLMP